MHKTTYAHPNCAATYQFTQREGVEPSRCRLANTSVHEYDCAYGAGRTIGSPPLPALAQILWQKIGVYDKRYKIIFF